MPAGGPRPLRPPGGPWYGPAVRDPHEVLGVGRGASDAELKTAFRRLAAQHHPDRNPGDPAAHDRFTELNQAYQILSDPQKRAAWERYGEAAFRPGGAGPGGMPFVDLGGFDGMFGDILAAMGIRGGDRGNLRVALELSFEEAARGCEKVVQVDVLDRCDECKGSGAEPGASVTSCGACSGRGRVRFQQAMFPIALERPCSRCRGTGQLPSSPCKRCSGAGLGKKTRSVEVSIPAGVDSGSNRTVEGGGSRTSADRPPGDLEIIVEVAPHPLFHRDGDHVVCVVPVSFVQAAVGGDVEVPTLDGKVKLRVPPATQPGTVLRIKGKGLPHRLRAGRGDQLVEISVEVPTELSERARELLVELGKELGEDVQPKQRTFVEKLKSLFE